MHITNCYYAGVYKSLTEDRMGAIETAVLMVALGGLGIGLCASYVMEKKILRGIARVEGALRAAEESHSGRPQAEISLQLGQQTLEKIRRVRYVLLTITALSSALVVARYCKIGCPGFDVWADLTSQFKQIVPPIPRTPSSNYTS
jgi:hypothetical protein